MNELSTLRVPVKSAQFRKSRCLIALFLVLAVLAISIPGCALRPAAEKQERNRLADEGRPWREPSAPPVLPDKPAVDDYISFALLSNADIQAKYWAWASALEQVPQDSSWPRIAVPISVALKPASMRLWDRTTLGIGNSPMTNIPFPTKLSTAGRLALEKARAAGLRFEQARFDLKGKVYSTWLDIALLAEKIRIQKEQLALLKMLADQLVINLRPGAAAQAELLNVQTSQDLAQDALSNLESEMPGLAAKLNALLGRPALTPVPMPELLPAERPFELTDEEAINMGAERSPALAALARDASARDEALSLARQSWLPDFGLSASITGTVQQTIGGMLVLPTQWEAIRAGIAQARDEQRIVAAMRLQYQRDLAASFVFDLSVLRNDDRRIKLFQDVIMKRVNEGIELAQSSYSSGRGSFRETVESRLVALDVRLVTAQLIIEREKAIVAIETYSAVDVERMNPSLATK